VTTSKTAATTVPYHSASCPSRGKSGAYGQLLHLTIHAVTTEETTPHGGTSIIGILHPEFLIDLANTTLRVQLGLIT